jgi:ABC-type uncharacterized transport system involved in gliding motility auxiliary subunit
METALRFSGYLGLVLLGFGLAGAAYMRSFGDQPVILLHLVGGVLCLLAWAATGGLKKFSGARSVMAGRRARYGYNLVAYSAVFVGLLVVANIFATLNERRWDVTEQGVRSLAPKSASLIASLKKPLRIVAIDSPPVQNFMGGEDPVAWRERVKTLLDLYKYNNREQVTVELIDPRSKPVEVDRLGMKPGNLIYLQYGEGDSKVINRLNEIDEQSITNALLKLTRGESKKVYYVQGHNEPQLELAGEGGMKEFVDALNDESIKTEGLNLAQTGIVPTDAAAVILAAPKRNLPQAEVDALLKYAQDGGRLILMANIEDRDSSTVRELAKVFGIEVGNDLILDEQLKLFSSPGIGVQFFAQSYGTHAITTGLSKSDPPVFTFASSVTGAKDVAEGVSYTEIVKSGPRSWAEKSLDLIFSSQEPAAAKDAADVVGPVSLAVAYEKKLQGAGAEDSFEKMSRVVVFGDATWVQNGSLSASGNRDLFLSSVNWILGEEGGVVIGPKSMRASTARFPVSDFNMILALSFIGPELILLLGLFIWWKRKVALA